MRLYLQIADRRIKHRPNQHVLELQSVTSSLAMA